MRVDAWPTQRNNHPGDPIARKDGSWYFYDETWADFYGPFSTEEEAELHLDDYCLWLRFGISPEMIKDLAEHKNQYY